VARFFIEDSSGRRPVRFTDVIAEGAAGTIHRVIGEPGIVVKIYKDPKDLKEYEEKVEAMLMAPPELPRLPLKAGTLFR
jgi:hypothetical protein